MGLFGKRKPSTARYVECMKRGEFAQALAVVDSLLQEGPNVAMSWRARGECLFEMSRYDEAIIAFDKASQLGGPGMEDVLMWKAFCLHNSGKQIDAERELTDLINFTPHDWVRCKADEVRTAFRQA